MYNVTLRHTRETILAMEKEINITYSETDRQRERKSVCVSLVNHS